MNVLFDLTPALTQTAGIGRYARELALALAAQPDGPKLALHFPLHLAGRLPRELDELPRVAGSSSTLRRKLTGLTGLRPLAGNIMPSAYDLFHAPDTLTPPTSLPLVITVHDLSPLIRPQDHARRHRLFFRLTLPRLLKKARAVITPSSATKQDLIRLCAYPAGRVHVVPLGVTPRFFLTKTKEDARSRASRALNLEPPYILSVGTDEPRKNISALLRAYARLKNPPLLALAGPTGWGRTNLKRLIAQLGLIGRVMRLGLAPEEILPDLYAGAELFVYPSLYEGFGLPVLEAMAGGTPVITTTGGALPETAGDAALLVSPGRIDELAEAMAAILAQPSLAQDLSDRGRRRAQELSWNRTAAETVKVYEGVLEGSSS